jgi:hypothetical protein
MAADASKKSDRVSEDLLEKYFSISREAFKMASEKIDPSMKKEAKEILEMSSRYISDAEFFRGRGDYVKAFAALNYAHGWLDTGSRLGIFNVSDSRLFVLK